MESDYHWPTVTEVLRRAPTPLEEALCLYLIRTGNEYTVKRILRDEEPDGADAIRAVGHAADLVVEHWNSLDQTHQDALSDGLRRLLWRIEGPKVKGTWQDAANAMIAGE